MSQLSTKVLITPSERAAKLVSEAISCGYRMALINEGLERRTVSRKKAEKLFGKYYLKVWEEAGLIKGLKRGSGTTAKREYDLLALHELQLSDTYDYFLKDDDIK